MTDPTPDLQRIVKEMTGRLTDEEWNALEANPGIHPGPRDDPDLQRIVEEMAPAWGDPELDALKVLVDEFWKNASPRQVKSLLARYPVDTSLFLTQDWQEYIEDIWRRTGGGKIRGLGFVVPAP